jgi:ectoine hydroxylase-related dioxygenase (phytanoyl-CoA dioxygenase family)
MSKVKSNGVEAFQDRGFLIQPDVLTDAECDLVAQRLDTIDRDAIGTRRLLEQSWCRVLAESLKQHALLLRILPIDSVVVQCTLFAKSADVNWGVGPHQDLSIPVASRVETGECSGWSEKEGLIFTQPPDCVLEQLIAVRLHIDAFDSSCGPLRVAPGSHRFGRLQAAKLGQTVGAVTYHECVVPRGGALVMRPLLVHASSRAIASVRRRVLHFLFGPRSIPFGLRWADIG